jgi:hypothetical protein
VKLDVLANTIKEMMQKIGREEELVVRRPYVPLVPEWTRINVPKHFAAQPQYSEPPKDYFMYSIHHTVEDEVQNQRVVENSPDMICMFNGISSMDDLPKYDQCDDDHKDEIDVDCSKKSTACRWQEEDQLQLRYDNHPLHNNHDSDEENAENFRVREKSLPLCFSSFQFLRGNCKQVVNSREGECSDQLGEDASADVEVVLNPELQPFTFSDFQIPDESLKPETNYELIQNNSVPLCFNSFQILKETLEQVLKDKYIKSQEISFESMQQSCQSFQDPITDRLDDLWGQNHSSFASHELKSCYDIDMIRQSVTGCVQQKHHFRTHQKSCSHVWKCMRMQIT